MQKTIKNINKRIKKTGRPPVSEVRVRKLEEAFKNLLSVTEACLYSGVGRSTYYEYIRKNEEFADKMNYAQKFVLIKAKEKIVKKIVQDGSDVSDIELAKWLIERRDKDFKTDPSIEVNVATEMSVNEKKAEDERQARLIKKMEDGAKAVDDYWKRKYDTLQKNKIEYEK